MSSSSSHSSSPATTTHTSSSPASTSFTTSHSSLSSSSTTFSTASPTSMFASASSSASFAEAPVSSKPLVAAISTLAVIGVIAIAFIIWWTYHLKIPNGMVTLKDMENAAPEPPPKHRRRGPSISGAVALGGGLVRKATTKLLSSSGAGPSTSRRELAAKITPFGSSASREEEDKPRFVHIPGQNMRIATRLPTGAWTFSEPDVRSNRRSTSAASWFGLGGSNANANANANHGVANGRTSAYGLGGYNGIDVGSVEQVSPRSSYFHHRPRYPGGGESSASVNTYGLHGDAPLPSPSSFGGHSPFAREEEDDDLLPLPPPTQTKRNNPRVSIPASAYSHTFSPSTSPTTSTATHGIPFTLTDLSPPMFESPFNNAFSLHVEPESRRAQPPPRLDPIEMTNPFEVPLQAPSPPPKTPRSKAFNFMEEQEREKERQRREKEKEKEMEAAYGFTREEYEVEAPPPAYDRERERERTRGR
ncbi:hypothetical protein V5O48_016761 [Marasmius crinis-equi]|uniref:Uncharacterized protein n=1 Tax=Marasmius crinis-equi TaxID=585013 RepID=A0ABR3EQU6_9AGAR